jgi:hypothetical protein
LLTADAGKNGFTFSGSEHKFKFPVKPFADYKHPHNSSYLSKKLILKLYLRYISIPEYKQN